MSLFIKFEHIKDEVTIDCRTEKEFYEMPLFQYNIPIITERYHLMIKRFYPCALFIIIYWLYRDKDRLKNELMKCSEYGNKKIIIGCSRGRLRSPILCLYARYLGIDAVILSKGLKQFLKYKR